MSDPHADLRHAIDLETRISLLPDEARAKLHQLLCEIEAGGPVHCPICGVVVDLASDGVAHVRDAHPAP